MQHCSDALQKKSTLFMIKQWPQHMGKTKGKAIADPALQNLFK